MKMQGRKIVAQVSLAGVLVALTATAVLLASRADGDRNASAWRAPAEPARVSQALGATTRRTPVASPTPAATPTLRETLLAANELVRAGLMPSPAPTPTLKQILESADALVKIGAIDPPPTLRETLIAADELVRAGVIPPPPTLEQVLLAADKLRIAGLLPAPAPQPTPTLEEILLAADAIRIANEPPPAPVAPPPAPAPTSTPAPPPPALPSAPPPTSTPAPPPPPPSTSTPVATNQSGGTGFWDANFTAQVLALVNQRRASAGLGPVSSEPRLEQAARGYAKVLADTNTFAHVGPDGSTLVTRVTATGFPFDVQIGEVLAWGSDHWQPAEIVQAWMDSPGHREQLLGPYTRAGAGCYFTDNGSTVRCVIDFAG